MKEFFAGDNIAIKDFDGIEGNEIETGEAVKERDETDEVLADSMRSALSLKEILPQGTRRLSTTNEKGKMIPRYRESNGREWANIVFTPAFLSKAEAEDFIENVKSMGLEKLEISQYFNDDGKNGGKNNYVSFSVAYPIEVIEEVFFNKEE